MRITCAAALAMVVLAMGMWAGTGRSAGADPAGGIAGPVDAGKGPSSQPAEANPPAAGEVKVEVHAQGGFGGGQVVVGAQGAGGGHQTQMTMASNVGRIEYASNNGDEHLKVADAAGKELFNGPVNSPEQRRKVPADAIAILKKMVGQGGVMGIGMGGGRVNVAGGMAVVGGGNARVQIMPAMRDPLAELVAQLDEGGRVEEFSRQVGDYTVKVTISAEGKHRATITGKDGKAAFDGPVDTAEQWKAIKDVPADVVDAAKSMDASLAKETEAKKATPTSVPEGK